MPGSELRRPHLRARHLHHRTRPCLQGAGYALASQPGLHNGVIGGLLGLAGSLWPTLPCWSDPLAALARRHGWHDQQECRAGCIGAFNQHSPSQPLSNVAHQGETQPKATAARIPP